MKKLVLYVILSVLHINISAQQKEEFRGVWLTNVDSYVLNTDKNIAEAMDYLSSTGINVVFPVVYNKGYTLYPSAVMDSLFGQPVIPDKSFSTRDFLQRLVIEAHRNGIEVIPWFEFGFSSSYSLNGGHIIKRFPSWALKNRNGNLVVKNGFDWLSGINPDVQNYMLALIMETARNYDVDGIQGDDRLPAMPVEGGYDSAAVAIYKAEHKGAEPPYDYNTSSWMKWRADKLTEYLERIRDSVKSYNSNLILSVSPSPYYWGYAQYLQDSKTWAQKNILDNIIPQLYQYDLANYNYALNTTWNDVGQYDGKDFYAGVLAKVGSYVVSEDLLEDMIRANRNKGVNGECFFFYEALRANSSRLGQFLAEKFYNTPALLPYRNGNIWRPRADIVNEDSSWTEKTGTWVSYNMPGFTGAVLRTSETASPASVTYNFNVSNTAYYDVYVYKTPNLTWTANAVYTLYSDADSQKVAADQSNMNEKGWHKAGTVFLSKGSHPVLKIDNSGLEEGRYLVTDAVMLMINRKMSPEVVVNVEAEKERTADIPHLFNLSSNYPNPFNPVTRIDYSVPSLSSVRINVYDILGREVAVLTDKVHTPGEYTVSFNAEGLPGGVYLYQLQSQHLSITGKMVLLK